jgi:uncharacterized protein (TIGR03435 family)
MTLMVSLMVFVLLAPAGSLAGSQDEYWTVRPPRVGDAAPPFRFADVLAPGWSGVTDATRFSSDRLRGRVVVLDFFATWCGPCIAAIPHMNALVADTADLPVTYLAVGREPADVLRKALARHPMDAPFVHDADGSVSTAYWVTTLPHVVVIDRAGRIARVTHPTQLTRESIVRAAGSGATAPTRATPAGGAQREGAQRPAASLTIHETESRAGSFRQHQTTGELLANGVDARRLLRAAWNLDSSQLDIRAALPEAAYDVHIIPPARSPGAGLAMLRATLDGLLGVSSRIETREVEGYRLSIAPGRSPLQSGDGGGRRISRGRDRLELSDVPIEEIVRSIGQVLDRPVVDETGLTGPHSLRITWQGTGPEPVLDALRRAGFAIREGKIRVNVLVVEPAEHP